MTSGPDGSKIFFRSSAKMPIKINLDFRIFFEKIATKNWLWIKDLSVAKTELTKRNSLLRAL